MALVEVRRILRTDGRLIFIEHGLAPDSGVRVWQERLTPLWKRVAGGCHMNRSIDRLITEAGFRLVRIEKDYGAGPKPLAYLYKGVARPTA